jgi:DNA-binding MurR/RpiR family transcriptional regulator
MRDISAVTRSIEGQYPQFSPQLRRAARYVLGAPTDIALYPLRRVAATAGVGATTMVRLANILGFESYEAFRDLYRENLRSGTKRYSARAKELQVRGADSDFEKLFRETESTLTQSVQNLFASISFSELSAAAELVARARKVCVIGLRAWFAAAYYFYYVSQTFTDKVVLAEGRGGMMIDEIGDVGAEDVVIGMSFDPYMLETVRIMRYASERGAKLIALTDSPVSPIAIGTARVFVLPTASTSFYQSLVPTMAFLETLLAFIVPKGGQESVDRIREGFERREAFGVYWRERD